MLFNGFLVISTEHVNFVSFDSYSSTRKKGLVFHSWKFWLEKILALCEQLSNY